MLCIIYLSIGVGLAFSTSYYQETFRRISKDHTYLFLGGWIATTLGVMLVHSHNIWVPDWRVLITMVSWMILLKGILLLAIPQFIKLFEEWFTPRGIQRYMLPMVIALGLVFGYFGFLSY